MGGAEMRIGDILRRMAFRNTERAKSRPDLKGRGIRRFRAAGIARRLYIFTIN